MGKVYTEITPELAAWVQAQHLFFVATAPLDRNGHVNCSPKGLDTLRITGPRSVAYLDLTGSGSETIAHVRENGRIVLMFCTFDGPPKIVRFHGTAEVVSPAAPDWQALIRQFPPLPSARAIVSIQVTRISDSCGYGVPKFNYVEERDALVRWAHKKGEENLPDYRRKNNATSIDGLPGADFD